MEPFVYENSTRPKSNRSVLIAVLAGAALCAWYFELIPEIAPAPTGSVDNDALPEGADSEFAALLKSSEPPVPVNSDSTDSETKIVFGDFSEPEEPPSELQTPDKLDDPLLAAIAAQQDVTASIQPTAPEPDVRPVSFAAAGAKSGADASASPEVLDASLAKKLREIDQQIATRKTLEAHAAMSRLYWGSPESRPHLQQRLQETSIEIYVRPTRHFAPKYTVQFGDTLDAIAAKHQVPWAYLSRLNRIQPEQLQAGAELKVLQGPFQAIVERQSQRLTVHVHGWYVNHYPIRLKDEAGIPSGDCQITQRMGEYDQSTGHVFVVNDAVRLSGTSDMSAMPTIVLEDRHMADVYSMLSTDSVIEIR